jgi:hypothetical protein
LPYKQYCCKLMAEWSDYIDDDYRPYILIGGVKYFVSYCPFCGLHKMVGYGNVLEDKN